MSFVFIFLVNIWVFASSEPDLLTLSKHPSWQKLLHHQQIQGSSFYLTSTKASETLVELQANLKALKTDPNYNCLFPARAKFLSAQLNLSYIECPTVTAWKNVIAADRVSLIYVAQYISNPASAFGHTFLLFRNSSRPLNLNYIVANAATIPDNVGEFDYIFKGLMGGFPAEYTYDHLYLKTQEYSHIENRDMWIYDLTFSKEQTDLLLNHIWELSLQGKENYYFLNRNCAVNIYNALAAVHPDLELIPRETRFVLPTETLVKVHPLTEKIEYWPSVREKMAIRSKNLNDDEAVDFKLILSKKKKQEESKSIEVAELVLENFELLRSRQEGILTSAQEADYKNSLLHRAGLGVKPRDLEVKRPPSPHDVLRPSRLSIGGTYEGDDSVYSISVAPFYHSLLERPTGYVPFSEFIGLDFKYEKRPDFSRKELTILKMANYPDRSLFDWPWSWRLNAGFGSLNPCGQCVTFQGELSAGKSLAWMDSNRAFALVGAVQERDMFLSPQVSVGGISEFSWGNWFYQGRVLQDVKQEKTKSFFDLGASFPIGQNSNFEIFGILMDEKTTNYRASFGFHF